MKLNKITDKNKPYIEICFNDGNIFIPIKANIIDILSRPNAFYIEISPLKKKDMHFLEAASTVKDGYTVKLYCSDDSKAYLWNNAWIKCLFIRRKERFILLSRSLEGKIVERRKGLRYIINQDINVKLNGTIAPAIAKDISYGGIGIKIAGKKSDINIDDNISIFFSILNQPLEGIIKRVEQVDFNNVFIGIECEQNIENYFIFKRIRKATENG